ncbi:hypothetical protein RIF29_40880 [Crotalaria pallida]|uniref:Uncharacterized protein n=1 Tax=Crotalaria pallida TaxID=3830 RepID=A0AAN9E6Y3_CROPI
MSYNRQIFSLRVNGHTPTKQLPFSLSAFSHRIFVKGKSIASANPISFVDDDVFTGAQPEPPSSLPSTLSLHSPSLKPLAKGCMKCCMLANAVVRDSLKLRYPCLIISHHGL